MKKILLALIAVVLLAACNKDTVSPTVGFGGPDPFFTSSGNVIIKFIATDNKDI